MNYFYSTFSTPVGRFSVAVNEAGAVVATAFGNASRLRQRLTRRRSQAPAALVADEKRTQAARDQVLAYFQDRRRSFALPLAPAGTDFQRQVWTQLQRIPYGETRSYADVARLLGTSARAVGNANGANPICLVVPCHRVIGADGSLTGFAFGTKLKRQLLEHENGGGAAT